MVKTCDFECYQLAAHFLEDEPCRSDQKLFERHCDSLAKQIQQTIEDWFISPDDEPETDESGLARDVEATEQPHD